MLLYELTENVVNFPTKEVRHRAMLDKLRRRSSYYNDSGSPTDQHPDLKPKEPHLKAVPDIEEDGKVKRAARKYVPGYGKAAARSRAKDYGFSAQMDKWYDEEHGDEDAARNSRIAFKAMHKLNKIGGIGEEAAGVGIITKQNTTADVKPGETGRQANKFNLDVDSKGTPKLLKP